MDLNTMLSLSKLSKLVLKFLKKAFKEIDIQSTTSLQMLELNVITLLHSKLILSIIDELKSLPIENILLLCELKRSITTYTEVIPEVHVLKNLIERDAIQGFIHLCTYVVYQLSNSIQEFTRENNLPINSLRVVSNVPFHPKCAVKVPGGFSYERDNSTIYEIEPIVLGKLHLVLLFVKEDAFVEHQN